LVAQFFFPQKTPPPVFLLLPSQPITNQCIRIGLLVWSFFPTPPAEFPLPSPPPPLPIQQFNEYTEITPPPPRLLQGLPSVVIPHFCCLFPIFFWTNTSYINFFPNATYISIHYIPFSPYFLFPGSALVFPWQQPPPFLLDDGVCISNLSRKV